MLNSVLLSLVVACGEKNTAVEVATPPTPPVEEVVEAPVEEPEAIEEPMPEPKPEPNSDFNTTLTFSDGTTKSGHVIRVERSSDFYGMKEWYDSESRLTIFAEAGSSAKDLMWTEVKSITVAPKSGDISCVYESDWSPWLYICTNKTTTSLVDGEGKKWGVDAKNKWKFYFDDDTEVEFWIQNIRAMQQDTVEVQLGMDAYENPEIYAQLRNEVQAAVYVKKITID
jgi:hypothetical protein